MEQKAFKELFDRFIPSGGGFFTEADWDKALNEWQPYYDDIISSSGLPIEKWVKNKDGYLPDFLDTKEQKFGHARIGNYDQVKIYQYTGKDTKRKNKYTNMYIDNRYIADVTDLMDDYQSKIQSLLRRIVEAKSLNDIYVLEKSDEYQQFSSQQILRKITILCSLMPSSSYIHAFMWFFNNEAQDKLAEILDVDKSRKTFLEFNHEIYEKAKYYAGINSASTKSDYIKLYCLLLFLSDSSYNTAELSDFDNCNVIFNGAPGTGKTYSVLHGIEKLQTIDDVKHKKPHKYIQFHPSFTYQDFIEGIKPMGITAGGNVELKVVNGTFKDFCIYVKKENEAYYASLREKPDPKDATAFKDWPHYYFVVDEINRGNLSNVFGETFTLLERDYRDYDFSGNYIEVKHNLVSTVLSNVVAATGDDSLIYKKIGGAVYFGIPFNIHFIGIMNDVDRSIDAFDLALRRRFKWIPMECKYDVIEEVLSSEGYDPFDVEEYKKSCEALNKFICTEGLKLGSLYEIGHAFFLKIRYTGGRMEITRKKKKDVFDNYISGTLKEYIRLVAEEIEIDGLLKKAETAFGIRDEKDKNND